MRIKKHVALLATIALMTLLQVSSAQTSNEQVQAFAFEVRRLIAESDISGFRQLSCVPANNTISEEAIERIFGPSDSTSDFERIMREPMLEVEIIGPYTREDHWPNSSYMITYYTSESTPFDSNDRISDEIGRKELYKSFLEMEVTISNGTVHFHRTPFYLGAHHPYVGDY